MEPPELAIIFGRTKRRVAELSEALMKRGYACDGLHGDLSQNQRDTVMRKFRDGSIDVLVATDVAARGLDVSGVTHVINFDLPQDPESYVHRIGRTGRAGKEGTSWSFVTARETDHLHFIEKLTRHRITKKILPTISEAMEGKQKLMAERILRYGSFRRRSQSFQMGSDAAARTIRFGSIVGGSHEIAYRRQERRQHRIDA